MINLLHKRNAGRIPIVIQQEDLIRLIVINAEVNVRCVMVFKGAILEVIFINTNPRFGDKGNEMYE